MSNFTAKHIVRSAHFELRGEPGSLFELFTPLGEKRWVKDWDPVFLSPSNGTLTEGMVFVTNHNAEQSFWSVVALDRKQNHVRYTRVTPDSRFGFVDVTCSSAGTDLTRITVTYSFTALTERGNEYLDSFNEKSYAEMIHGWRELIQKEFPATIYT